MFGDLSPLFFGLSWFAWKWVICKKMALNDVKFKYDQTVLKVYGYGDNKKIKVVRMNCLRTAGIECDDDVRSEKGSVNDAKLEENIQRAKGVIFEYAFCNPWDWFFTATLDPNKYDRTDLEKFHKDLTQWFRDYGKKYDCKIKFLLIPELHSDGKSWHMHGFLYGLPLNHLKQFCLGDVMGKALSEKVKNGDTVYNWIPYQKKFGFCDLEPIRNPEAVSKYITKYINKNLASSVTELNAHLYYHSRGLDRAEVIKKGTMCANIVPSFENEYCSIAWLDFSDSILRELVDSFLDIDYCNTRVR